VGPAAGRLRLHLRQAALRSLARGQSASGAGAPPRRARLSGTLGEVPREPRRAARRGDVSRRGAPGRGGGFLLRPRHAVHSRGPGRGASDARLDAPGAGAASRSGTPRSARSTIACSRA
jgi:hypothetical protein